MGNRLTKITTRMGDKGMTSFGGGCNLISKGHPFIELIGAIDELNASVGMAKAQLKGYMFEDLQQIQQKLFDMGAEVFMNRPDRIYVHKEDIEVLERLTEHMTGKLPPLRDFIFPGVDIPSSFVHVARTVCRRAETVAVRCAVGELDGLPEYVRYLNRLSDFLFQLARCVAQEAGHRESTWTRS